MQKTLLLSIAIVTAASALAGCGGGLAAPFDQLKSQRVTVYRLQNFEPPPAAMGPNGLPLPVPVPQEIQTWLGGVGSMLPPTLIPPGLLPGGTPAPTANVARFHNFRILGWMQVTDQGQKDEILDVFGKDKGWEATRSSCMYAEFGFSFGNTQPAPGQPLPLDVLVSLSCNQVQAFNFNWPHAGKMSPSSDASSRITTIVRKAFGG